LLFSECRAGDDGQAEGGDGEVIDESGLHVLLLIHSSAPHASRQASCLRTLASATTRCGHGLPHRTGNRNHREEMMPITIASMSVPRA
jgi:hypothetical protein